MGALWFWIVVFMLTSYVVLDGFDLGVGIIYLFVARSEEDRKHAVRAIGPIWNGNEVWLLAAGGTLFFAFPLLYATAFSGFYLPLMIVLWLLILRGISVELRGQSGDPLWRTFFDTTFSIASAVLAVFFGAALANVIRGVPIGPDGYFFLPLWTDWRTGPVPGILDWYTVAGGVLALIALSLHGSLYLAIKTEGVLEQNAIAWAKKLWPAVLGVTLITVPATVVARPDSLRNYEIHPFAFLSPILVVASLSLVPFFLRSGKSFAAFASSSIYLIAMLGGAAAGLFPVLLPSVGGNGQSITVERAIAGPHTLHVGLVWWIFGILLALTYFTIIYTLFRGKVSQQADGYSH